MGFIENATNWMGKIGNVCINTTDVVLMIIIIILVIYISAVALANGDDMTAGQQRRVSTFSGLALGMFVALLIHMHQLNIRADRDQAIVRGLRNEDATKWNGKYEQYLQKVAATRAAENQPANE